MHIAQYRTVQCSTSFDLLSDCWLQRDKLFFFFFFLQDDNDSRRSKSTILCARSLLLVVYSLLLFSLSHSLTLAASSSSSSFVSLRTKGINSRKDFAFTTTTFDVLWVFSYLKLTDVSLSQFVIHSPKPDAITRRAETRRTWESDTRVRIDFVTYRSRIRETMKLATAAAAECCTSLPKVVKDRHLLRKH